MRDMRLYAFTAVAIALAGASLGLAGCDQRREGQVVGKAPDSPPATATAPATTPPATTPPAATAPPVTPAPAAGTPPAEGRSATAGQAVDDTALTAKVKTALLADDKVKGLNINVDTNNGVVTLTGKAGSPEEKSQALKVVRGIEGVKNVEDRIAVN
jgi:hyperosmotically inducible periplasmic protein